MYAIGFCLKRSSCLPMTTPSAPKSLLSGRAAATSTRDAGAAILFEVKAVFGRDARQGRGEGAGSAFAIAPRADHGIGVAHGAALGPRDVLSEVRRVADEIGRARAGGDHIHARERVDDAHLVARKFLADAQRLPVLDVHPGGIQRGQHARLAAAIGHLRQEVQARFAEIIVAHARDLHGGDGHHPLCAVDRAQRDENLHRLLRGAALLAIEHLLVLQELVCTFASNTFGR